MRGLTQRELLTQRSDRLPADLACCGNCRYMRGQRCRNPASPLFDFKVTPDGYCPVFEPVLPSQPSFKVERENGDNSN